MLKIKLKQLQTKHGEDIIHKTALHCIYTDDQEKLQLKGDVEKSTDKNIKHMNSDVTDNLTEIKNVQEKLNELTPTKNIQAALQLIQEKVAQDLHNKMKKLQQQKEDAGQLDNEIKQKLLAFEIQNEQITSYKQLFEKEKTALRTIFSDIIKKKQEMESQLKKMAEIQLKNTKRLKEGLKQDKDNLDKERDMIKTKNMELEEIRSDIQKQTAMLQLEKQQIQEDRDKLETTKTELDKKKQCLTNFLEEMDKEKTKLKNVVQHLKQQSKRFRQLERMICSTQTTRDTKDQQLKAQVQKLRLTGIKLQEVKEKLKALMTISSTETDKIRTLMTSLNKDKDIIKNMKMEIQSQTDLISSQKESLKDQWTKLKTAQNEMLKEMKPTKNIQAALQLIQEKVAQDLHNKMKKLQQQKEDAGQLDRGNQQKTYKQHFNSFKKRLLKTYTTK
ncbi:cingulin [Austrofundulus limnaeus]|uniref:Cingulin n=1 Tax=Austrofundulus limnaeus TaxID=52670 RepID=A0A2I4CMC9_AUSLI|nr:PREDICTED: cingulin-like [Austrofundulus limnaeus]